MAKKLQLRRGTTSQHSSFTGAEGEVTVDTDKEVVVVHNGSTAGGFPMARPPASAGTVAASEVAQVDANKDITGFRNITLTGELDAATGDFSGNVDIDGTCEADAYTVNGTALDTHIAGVTVTNATNAVTATNANHVSVADNESTNENNLIPFIEDASATGNVGLESDGDFHYNPSTGLVSVPAVTTTGNVVVGGDLTVSGTTATVNTTNLDVEDKNIVLGKVSSPSDTTADGGGITLKGASDKTITWVNSTDTWDFNQGIKVTGTGTFTNSLTSGTAWASGDGVTAESGGNLYIRNDSESGAVFAIQNGGNGTGGDRKAFITGDGAGVFKDYIQAYGKTDVNIGGNIADNATAFAIWDDAATTETFKVTGGGAVTSTSTISDSKGNVRSIPQNTQGSTYTLVAADAGKHILASGTVTIPNSIFSAGDAVTIINNTGSNLTLTAAAGLTLYNSADGSNGNLTLATRGMASVLFATGSAAYISGAGLS